MALPVIQPASLNRFLTVHLNVPHNPNIHHSTTAFRGETAQCMTNGNFERIRADFSYSMAFERIQHVELRENQ
jgi:hypothetical protein